MKSFLSFFFLIALSLHLHAKTITGVVTDETNQALPGVNVLVKGTSTGTQTNFDGKFSIEAKKGDVLVFSYLGYKTREIKVDDDDHYKVELTPDRAALEEVVIVQAKADRRMMIRGFNSVAPPVQQESYKEINENTFKSVRTSPLSTFSIDVDKAAYSNIRRMLNNGQKVPADAVKIEEMINYFDYDYAQPKDGHPFAIHTEVARTPWDKETRLVKIALQGKEVPLENVPPSNLVFLIDVSGSMNAPNKLPLLQSSFKLLTEKLREQDKVAIVVYAGAAGLVLPPTSGDEKNEIKAAIDELQAGGSTAGGEGIELAYKVARENFIKGGNNRVILATDGDFNVGASSDKEMKDLIKEKRESGVFLTVLGFGMGNYKDSKLETLAQTGNGNHAYIDTMQEAQRVLGTEFGGTMYTIAKDVKIQVEFNPAKVQSYRLIGYENRLLNDEDFNDDKKDAGELGSGHTVTALYEIIPAGVESQWSDNVDDLRYSETIPKRNRTNELLTVKFRYKDPEKDKSELLTHYVEDTDMPMTSASTDFKFASAVALFGMKLRDSKYAKNTSLDEVVRLAEAGRGTDKKGYRAEFLRLVETAR